MRQIIDRNSVTPVYLQLKAYLEDEISQGNLSPGKRIPSENQLSRRCGVHRHTVRNSLRKLAEEGILQSVPSNGWFVKSTEEKMLRIIVTGNMASSSGILAQKLREGAAASRCELHYVEKAMLPEECGNSRFDALVLLDNAVELKNWEILKTLNLPVIVANRQPFGSNLPFAVIDQYYGCRDLVARLVNAGHTRIGCIASAQPRRYISQRYRGYCDALTAGNIDIDPGLQCLIMDTTDFHRQVRDLFAARPEMTGLFIGGAALHRQTFDVLKELKLRIPEDISLVVYDHPPHEYEYVTYLEQPYERLGLLLFKMVRRLCETGQVLSETINPVIINGKSIKTLTKH